MQDGALRPGNIADNIIGLSDYLTLDDAWRAARQAAVADDIEAMPMGMFTMVGDSMATFSGGQAQRIMIATAPGSQSADSVSRRGHQLARRREPTPSHGEH